MNDPTDNKPRLPRQAAASTRATPCGPEGAESAWPSPHAIDWRDSPVWTTQKKSHVAVDSQHIHEVKVVQPIVVDFGTCPLR
ncbi:hypothetical protein HYQ46_004042 [Verticillium longisporum]|nr:hypothetical protein HYQ46_004042 [Verticillium longisporum]